MEPSNGWGPATQLLGVAIQIADGGTLPRVLFMLCFLSVISTYTKIKVLGTYQINNLYISIHIVIVLINSQQLSAFVSVILTKKV